MVSMSTAISNLDTHIRWLENNEGERFPGYENVLDTMRDAAELLRMANVRISSRSAVDQDVEMLTAEVVRLRDQTAELQEARRRQGDTNWGQLVFDVAVTIFCLWAFARLLV